MTAITTFTKPCLWAVKHKDTAFPDVSVLLFCSVHTLIQLADMQTHLNNDLERAFFENLGGAIAFDEKVTSK